MNAIEALKHLSINTFDTTKKYGVSYEGTVDQRQLTTGRAIKLYRSSKGEIFGMVGVNLPEFISERRQARVAVNIKPSLQQVLLQMAEQSAVKYPHCLSADNFDFCLHAPMSVGGTNSLELLEGNNWRMHPGMQYAIKPISNSPTQVGMVNGQVVASFNNPQHLVGYFLGSNRFSFAVDLEAETYKVGKSEVYTLPDLFDFLGKTPKYMEAGETPHLPTINGRLLQLADTMDGYRAETVRPGMVELILDYYSNFKNNDRHEQAPVTVVTTDDEGW
jgi:hypothetical protein